MTLFSPFSRKKPNLNCGPQGFLSTSTVYCVVTKYSFYRGTEFLDFHIDSEYFHVCSMNCGAYFSMESWAYDDDGEKVDFERKIINGFGVCNLDIVV